nr:MAG TPA: hypothetical protein [Caudoviricetes sp.]
MNLISWIFHTFISFLYLYYTMILIKSKHI